MDPLIKLTGSSIPRYRLGPPDQCNTTLTIKWMSEEKLKREHKRFQVGNLAASSSSSSAFASPAAIDAGNHRHHCCMFLPPLASFFGAVSLRRHAPVRASQAHHSPSGSRLGSDSFARSPAAVLFIAGTGLYVHHNDERRAILKGSEQSISFERNNNNRPAIGGTVQVVLY